MARALALYSGGLDSLLSIVTIMRQGIDVKVIRFITPFNTKLRNTSSAGTKYTDSIFTINDHPIFEKFLEMLKNPKYGFGKNMNPCVDCKVLMLKEAKKIMLEEGYDFIVTGEVLSQRPMSQRRDTLSVIDREASVIGHVVRPLSARLLNPSFAEQTGMVNRELLFGFSGRSRKPQMKLAREMEIREYPQPASGCLLTDPLYSVRLRELIQHSPAPSIKDINLLQLGRHFRISSTAKVIVGRDGMDNELIRNVADPDDCLLWVENFGSSLTIIRGDASDQIIQTAASLCTRYSDAKNHQKVMVALKIAGKTLAIPATPASDNLVESLRI
jgi:hypothetical protein